jgi:ankyrin repeat protein
MSFLLTVKQKTFIATCFANYLKSKKNWRGSVPNLNFAKEDFPEIEMWLKEEKLEEKNVFLYINDFAHENKSLIVDFFSANIFLDIWREVLSFFGFKDSALEKIRKSMFVYENTNISCSNDLALIKAIIMNDSHAVEKAIEKGAQVSALEHYTRDTALLLMEEIGSDLKNYVNNKILSGNVKILPLLRLPVIRGNLELCRLLFSEKNVNFEFYEIIIREGNDKEQYMTLLQEAILQKNVEIVKLLCELGANPNMNNLKNSYKGTDFFIPLVMAMNIDVPLDIVKALIKAGADVNQWFSLPLSEEEQGIPPNNERNFIGTPLWIAAGIPGSSDKIEMLIKAKASLNGIKFSITPLTKAIKSGDLELVKTLIKFGVDVNTLDCFERSAIYYLFQFYRVFKFGFPKEVDYKYLVARELIQAGADINADKGGHAFRTYSTPLELAENAYYHSTSPVYVKISALLILKGAKTDRIPKEFLNAAKDFYQEVEEDVCKLEKNTLDKISGVSNIKIKFLIDGVETEMESTQTPMDVVDNFISRFEKLTLFVRKIYLRDYIKKSPNIIDYAISAIGVSENHDTGTLKDIIGLLIAKGVSVKEILVDNAHKKNYTSAWVQVFIDSSFGQKFDFRPTIELLLENGVNPEVVKQDILNYLDNDFGTDTVANLTFNDGKSVLGYLNEISSDESKEEKDIAENESIQGLDEEPKQQSNGLKP